MFFLLILVGFIEENNICTWFVYAGISILIKLISSNFGRTLWAVIVLQFRAYESQGLTRSLSESHNKIMSPEQYFSIAVLKFL